MNEFAQPITIAFSSDAKGFPKNATVIASVLRRTRAPVHVKFYCQGFLPESFTSGGSVPPVSQERAANKASQSEGRASSRPAQAKPSAEARGLTLGSTKGSNGGGTHAAPSVGGPHVVPRLTVEFIRADKVMEGNYPGHVGSAVFDRMQVVRDAVEWERCLIMDHDMLALCDLAPYFAEDFEGNLLMGRMFGPGNTLGVQMARRGGLPEKLAYAADYPYFYMGPMMNLALMRKERTWQKLLTAHTALGQEEQMALTIATEGRVKGVGRMWNMVPHWDNLSEGPSGPERSSYGTVGPAARWKNGLPEGLIHWTGYAKPWHPKSSVWRPDLWEAEATSWEALRQGWWEKPRVVEINPAHEKDVMTMAKRGWKVDVICEPKGAGRKMKAAALPCPDVRWHTPLQTECKSANWLEDADMVRVGAGKEGEQLAPLEWLYNYFSRGAGRPSSLVLRGQLKAGEIRKFVKFGYKRWARITRKDWPSGGPDPSVLDLVDLPSKLGTVVPEEDLYLELVK